MTLTLHFQRCKSQLAPVFWQKLKEIKSILIVTMLTLGVDVNPWSGQLFPTTAVGGSYIFKKKSVFEQSDH